MSATVVDADANYDAIYVCDDAADVEGDVVVQC